MTVPAACGYEGWKRRAWGQFGGEARYSGPLHEVEYLP